MGASFLVAMAGPVVTSGVVAYDFTKNIQNWKPVAQKAFGFVFAGVFTLIVAGLFYADQTAVAQRKTPVAVDQMSD